MDARHASAPSAAIVQQTGCFLAAHPEQMRGAKIAIVVSAAVQYGTARMAQITTEVAERPFTVRGFWDCAEAERWLFPDALYEEQGSTDDRRRVP